DPARVLAPMTRGEIVVRGPIVTPEYFRREASTRAAKIRGADGAIYHRMGDVGYLDQEGRLWMCGRKAHRVETAAGTRFTLPCEAVFNRHPLVRRTALVGVPTTRPGVQRPVVCVELEAGARIATSTLFAELRALGSEFEHTRDLDTFLLHPAFPVDARH